MTDWCSPSDFPHAAFFMVWDPCNSSEKHATRIGACNAAAAAESWAENDDGLDAYTNPSGVTIHVRDAEGVLHRFSVTADFSPTFYASELPADETTSG